MTKLVSSFNTLIGKILKKFYTLTFSKKILLVYLSFCIPFVYIHESHLPGLIIAILLFLAVLVGGLLCLGSVYLGRFLFGNREFQFLWEAIFILFGLVSIYFLGLLDNRAGVLFLFFLSIIYIFARYINEKVVFQILLFGLLILLNGMFTFKALQMGELFLFNLSYYNKYNLDGPDVSLWKWDEKTRTLTHESIGFKAILPEGYFFHNPENLKLEEKAGAGKLLGAISSSSVDPNTYPFLRFFYLPLNVRSEIGEIAEEYNKFLEFELNRGEIESLQSLGASKLDKKNWAGHFWIFYDFLRPRNAKSGFYLIPLSDGSHIVLAIRETLSEKDAHEPDVQSMLDSLQIGKSP